jgi:hypothetical protein
MAIRHIHLEQPLIKVIIEYGVYTSVLGIPDARKPKKSESVEHTANTQILGESAESGAFNN